MNIGDGGGYIVASSLWLLSLGCGARALIPANSRAIAQSTQVQAPRSTAVSRVVSSSQAAGELRMLHRLADEVANRLAASRVVFSVGTASPLQIEDAASRQTVERQIGRGFHPEFFTSTPYGTLALATRVLARGDCGDAPGLTAARLLLAHPGGVTPIVRYELSGPSGCRCPTQPRFTLAWASVQLGNADASEQNRLKGLEQLATLPEVLVVQLAGVDNKLMQLHNRAWSEVSTPEGAQLTVIQHVLVAHTESGYLMLTADGFRTNLKHNSDLIREDAQHAAAVYLRAVTVERLQDKDVVAARKTLGI
jgi:hypothetical protein